VRQADSNAIRAREVKEVINHIVKFPNQMVIVLDEKGNQIPRLQGWVGDVLTFIILELMQEGYDGKRVRLIVDELKYKTDCEIEVNRV